MKQKTVKIDVKYYGQRQEYAVRYIENGIPDFAKYYYTDCHADAIKTRKAMEQEANQKGYCVFS